MPKIQLKLAYKKQLIPKTYFLTFKTEQDFNFIPGQFFSLEVEPKTFRAYSTVQVNNNPPDFFEDSKKLPKLTKGNYVSFMISTKPGGKASKYFEEITPETSLNAVGPSGKFKLHTSLKDKVFIATGTGLAPFVPMIKELLDKDPEYQIYLFFAVWNKESDFSKQFFKEYDNSNYPNFKIYTVVDEFKEEDLDEFHLGGRVTTEVPKIITDVKAFDFYLCGHPAMVASMNEVLLELGSETVFMEKFGK